MIKRYVTVPVREGFKKRELQRLATRELQKTVEIYLPPITSKVTGFTTISQYMTYLQSLAASSSMPYVNITLDVSATINSYKFYWSNFTCFENAVIHLGDFHIMRENFQASTFSTVAIFFLLRFCTKSGSG